MQINEITEKCKAQRCKDVAEYNTFMRYLMSIIIFGHFQRPSVVSNMMLREFIHAKTASCGRTVILVSDHKTSASGPAQIALENPHYKLFKLYVQR
jgi:hypothetical protein